MYVVFDLQLPPFVHYLFVQYNLYLYQTNIRRTCRLFLRRRRRRAIAIVRGSDTVFRRQ